MADLVNPLECNTTSTSASHAFLFEEAVDYMDCPARIELVRNVQVEIAMYAPQLQAYLCVHRRAHFFSSLSVAGFTSLFVSHMSHLAPTAVWCCLFVL